MALCTYNETSTFCTKETDIFLVSSAMRKPPCFYDPNVLLGSKLCTEGDIRLVEGSQTEGTVQYCHNSKWGWVCGDSWTVTTAQVACKQLGLPSSGKFVLNRSPCNTTEFLLVGVIFSSYYKPLPNAGPYYLKSMTCSGAEQKLDQCSGINHGTWCKWQAGTGPNGWDYYVAKMKCQECK